VVSPLISANHGESIKNWEMDSQIKLQILAASTEVRGLPDDLFVFDDDDPEEVRLLFGLLFDASIEVLEGLFDDLVGVTSESAGSMSTRILSAMPDQFRESYDAQFVRKMIVAATDLFARFTEGWSSISYFAHQLLMKLLFDEMTHTAEIHEVPLPHDWRGKLEEVLLPDLDHEFLFDGEANSPAREEMFATLGVRAFDFDSWFSPYYELTPLPPYLT